MHKICRKYKNYINNIQKSTTFSVKKFHSLISHKHTAVNTHCPKVKTITYFKIEFNETKPFTVNSS